MNTGIGRILERIAHLLLVFMITVVSGRAGVAVAGEGATPETVPGGAETTPESPSEQDQSDTAQEERHDPLEGMDPSGRIPRSAVPEDIENPARWRYIPEGRILEGSILQRYLVSSFLVPLFFFESDVGVGAGLAVTDIGFRNQRRQELAGTFLSYTTEGQQNYSMVWKRWLYHQDLPEGGIIQEERSFLRANGGYSRTLTRRFFGLGPDTRESDETSYTDEVASLGGTLDLSFPDPGDDPVFNVGALVQHHSLGPGIVGSHPTTDDDFPVLFDDADSHDSLWLSAGLRYDTRDSQHNPYEGWAVGVNTDSSPAQSHGDVGSIVKLWGTGVLEVPGVFHDGGDSDEENPPTDVIAAAAFVKDTVGDLPFWALPSLGGSDTLRGYITNRWTGASAWHGSVEYRFWAIPRGIRFSDLIRIERLGAAVFFELGTVEDHLDSLFEANVHASYGFGLRASLERTAVFRVDFGFSDEGMNVAATFGLSF